MAIWMAIWTGVRGRRFAWCALVLVWGMVAVTTVWAGGPRWMSGAPYFNPTGYPVVWYTDHPQYFTDAGDLSTSVNHATADALVARAAGVWNVPTSRLVLTQGGVLGEHVSGANTYAGTSGLVFPSDVQSSNYQAMQIAVIYDSDGSVTDLMLGRGASDPSGCGQNAVTESVDSIVSSGYIQHALLVLNGRCTGSAPEMQLQMQYQLERAFGRVLGLAWSQLNDNVFTGTPTPTYNQALHWPIMHPIDIICGPYTYQCLPQPFTLRPDDISAISQLYTIAAGQAPMGKVDTLSAGSWLAGTVGFPNGQGMEAVNVVVHRMETFWNVPEPWEEVSGVTGYSFRRTGQTPLAAAGAGAMASLGTTESWREGVYVIQLVPLPANQVTQSVILSTQPINPLYTGTYAVGAYAGDVISPSGSSVSFQQDFQGAYSFTLVNLTPGDAASGCSAEGTETAPTAVAAGGWWTGSLCSYGHVAWNSLPVKGNRTLTVEVTANDEQGNGSMVKAMPGIGVWRSSDPVGSLPTVARTGAAFNGIASAMTSLPVTVGAAGQTLRISLADQRGAGRPDFRYNARVLYADAVTPTAVSAAGGVVTITGMGFRQGNAVIVNGAPATVSSWSPTTIVAMVPPLAALGATSALTADVVVRDLTSGGTTSIQAGLQYAAPVETLVGVSAPSGTVAIGLPAPVAFAVRAVAPDGVTGEGGKAIVFSAAGGGVQFGACGGAATCTVVTDGSGVASTTVLGTVQGGVVLSAVGSMGTVTAAFTAGPALPDVMRVVGAPTGTVTVGAAAPVAFSVSLMAGDGVTPRAGQAVTFTAAGGGVVFGACGGTATCTVATDSGGGASTMVTPTVAGPVILRAVAGTASASATFAAAAETMRLLSAPGGTGTVGTAAPVAFAVKVLAGDGVTPVAGEPVVLSAAGGAVRFGVCGGATCTVTTDGSGVASSTVTPLSAGAVTLSAVGSAGSVTAAMVAGVETVQVVHAPSGKVTVGTLTETAFAVRVLAGDGVTPVVGEAVVFTTTSGAVEFGSCGAAVCTVLTDASGVASTTMTPMAAGVVSVMATAQAGVATATVSAVARVRTVTAARAVEYVAEGATVLWSPQVAVADNAASTAGVVVSWTGSASSGMSFAEATSIANAQGGAGMAANLGPLAAGAEADGTACAWAGVCATVAARGVSLDALRAEVVSGGGQTVSAGSTLGAVVLRITDGAGDPVAGATVTVHQTVSEWEPACPEQGRCPVAAVYEAGVTTGVSDVDGLLTVAPMQVGGTAEVTQIGAVVGTQGFVTASLVKQP